MALPAALQGSWPWLVAGTVGALSGFVAYCNAPLSWKGQPQRAKLDLLSSAPLKQFPALASPTMASELWREHGAVFMAVRRPG